MLADRTFHHSKGIGAFRESIANGRMANAEKTLTAADPMICSLVSAPLDDEPSTADEDAAAAKALAAYQRGEGIPLDHVRAELDATVSAGPGLI